jgi:hypothetical protein
MVTMQQLSDAAPDGSMPGLKCKQRAWEVYKRPRGVVGKAVVVEQTWYCYATCLHTDTAVGVTAVDNVTWQQLLVVTAMFHQLDVLFTFWLTHCCLG